MIRILQLPGSLSLKNGRMHVIMNIYRKIDKTKFQFDFLATDMGDRSFEEEIRNLGGHIYTVPFEDRNNLILLRKMIKYVLLNNNYDIVHYHATSQWAVTLYGLKNFNIKQVIIHSHATTFSDSFIKSVRNGIMSLPIYISGTKYVAATYEAGKALFYGKKFEVVSNSIDVDRFKYNPNDRKLIRAKLGLIQNAVVVGNVGRFSKQKNQLWLIDVFYEILKVTKNKDWYLLLIGQGELRDEISTKVVELGIKKQVIILDTQSEIERYYSAMDVFCFPSIYEGFGMAAIEAEASGLPIVLSSVIPDAVKIKNVFELSLSDSLKKWSNKIIWASKLRIARENGKKIVEEANMDDDSIVSKWENMYIECK